MNRRGWYRQFTAIDGFRLCYVEVLAETRARFRVRALADGRGPGGGEVKAGAVFQIKKPWFVPDAVSGGEARP